MNKNKFVGLKSFLKKVNFEFKEEKDKEEGMIDLNDKIKILSIKEDIIEFDVIRELNFGGINKSTLLVENRCNLVLKEALNKETFINEIKKGFDLLLDVFAEISLTIANITNSSPFMTIITPPAYNKKEIIIE